MKTPSDAFYDIPYKEPEEGNVVAFIHGRGVRMGIVEEVSVNKCRVHGTWGTQWIVKKHVRHVEKETAKAQVLREVQNATS